jgi:hypothetical protein
MIARSSKLIFAMGALCLTQVCHSQQFGVGVHNNVVHLPMPGDTPLGALLTAENLTIRTDYHWQSVEESTKGSLSIPPVYKELDVLLTDLAIQGKKPLLVLDYGNKFYDSGDQPTSPEAIDAYVNYAKFVVAHFKGRVTQFEIWNEWNNGTGSTHVPPTKGTASAYVVLLKKAYVAIKAANPAASALVVWRMWTAFPYIHTFSQERTRRLRHPPWSRWMDRSNPRFLPPALRLPGRPKTQWPGLTG